MHLSFLASMVRTIMSLPLLSRYRKGIKNVISTTVVFFNYCLFFFKKIYKVAKDNMENLIILKVISKHDFSKCLKRCSGLLIREIQIKVISNYQNGKDLKVYFLLPLSRNILTSVGSIHWYCLTFLQRGLYLSKFKIHIFFRPIILLYPMIYPTTVLSDIT